MNSSAQGEPSTLYSSSLLCPALVTSSSSRTGRVTPTVTPTVTRAGRATTDGCAPALAVSNEPMIPTLTPAGGGGPSAVCAPPPTPPRAARTHHLFPPRPQPPLMEDEMPTRAPRPCTWPSGCPELTSGSRCARHARPSPAYRGSSTEQGYGQAWRKLRLFVLARDPICRDVSGCVEPSTDVDHIIPRRAGGSDEPSNLQGMCHRHHSAKTSKQDGGWGRGTRKL